MDDLMLIFRLDGALVTGRVLFGDPVSGERGAVCVSEFEKVTFALMLARLAEQVSCFGERDEKIGVTMRRSDLSQPAVRLDDETIMRLYVDPVSVIRSMSLAPTKIFLRRQDPSTTSPLRVGYDAIAATFGDEVYIRRRGDQVECPCCGRWANVGHSTPDPSLITASICRSGACRAKLAITLRSDRWASIAVTSLLANPDREKFFLPRDWTPSPWVTREDLEKKYRDWTKTKQEFA